MIWSFILLLLGIICKKMLKLANHCHSLICWNELVFANIMAKFQSMVKKTGLRIPCMTFDRQLHSLVSLRWFIQIRPNKFLVFLLISILMSDISIIYFTCFMGNHVTSKKYCSVYITYFKPNFHKLIGEKAHLLW